MSGVVVHTPAGWRRGVQDGSAIQLDGEEILYADAVSGWTVYRTAELARYVPGFDLLARAAQFDHPALPRHMEDAPVLERAGLITLRQEPLRDNPRAPRTLATFVTVTPAGASVLRALRWLLNRPEEERREG